MEPKPIQHELPIPSKPLSNTMKGYNGGKGVPFFNNNERSLLRNNLSISSWLLIGATLQSLLLILPIRPSYALIPAFFLLCYRGISTILMIFGLKHNPYMDGVEEGKYTGLYPSVSGSQKTPKNEEVCVLLVTARSNHPLGLFGPGYIEIADFFKDLTVDLEENAATNGFLGSSTYGNICDRSAAGAIMNVMYFRSYDHLHAFAHEEGHRNAWNWWNKNLGKHKHMAIGHEIYSVPAGKWETVYINSHATNFGSTSHLGTEENGDQKWMSPLFDARKGQLRTANGRMGSSVGDYKYDDDPYLGK